MDVVERINQLRQAAGLSANQLAKAAGIGQASLSDVLNRKNKPSLDSLERICRALGISLSEFFAEDFDEIPPDIRQLLQVAKKLSPSERRLLTKFLEEMTASRAEQKVSEATETRREFENVDTEDDEIDLEVQQLAAHMEGVYGIASPEFRREIIQVIKRTREKYLQQMRVDQTKSQPRRSNRDTDQ